MVPSNHMQFTPGTQMRSTSVLSPDRRGGRLTGPPACGQPSPPPLAQQATVSQAALAQQAYVALGQTEPSTARPHWRDPNVAHRSQPSPIPQRNAVSAQSLHAPAQWQQAANSRTPPLTAPPTAWALQHMPRSATDARSRQQSIGGCSACSIPPSGSPGTMMREPKNSIEVPVEAMVTEAMVGAMEAMNASTQPERPVPSQNAHAPRISMRDRVLTQRFINDQDGKMMSKTSEDIRRVAEVGAETSENVKELHGKFEDLTHYLKASEQDKMQQIEALKYELEQERRNAHEAREAAANRDMLLEHKDRQIREAEARASQAGSARIELERQLQEEVQNARVTDHERADVSAHLEAECRKKDNKITELQKQLRSSTDQANLYKAQYEALEKEGVQLREQLEEKEIENAQMRERYDLEKAALVQEKNEYEAHFSDVNGRYQAMALEQRDWQDQQMQQGRTLSIRDAQVRQREQELAEQAQEQSTRQCTLDRKEAMLVEMENMANHLQRERVDFDQQRLEAEQQLERQQNELERQTKEQRERHRRFAEADKENKSLRQTVQEQKKQMCELESQMHREKTIASFITPGEYIKLAKKMEGDLYAHENSELKRRNSNLKTDVNMVRWHNEVMQKHLPRSQWEAVRKELDAQPLPPREVAENPEL